MIVVFEARNGWARTGRFLGYLMAAVLGAWAPDGARAADEKPALQKNDMKLRLTLGIGPGFAQEYEGSDEYRAIPFIVARARWGARYSVGTDGTGLRADLVHFRFIEAGPAMGFRARRDTDASDPVIARLPVIDAAVEVGGFVAFNLPFIASPTRKDALTLDATYLKDVAGGHNGDTVRLSLRYRGLVTKRIALDLGPFATYGSEKFMQAYYGVSQAGAAASGLDTFDPDDGWYETGIRVGGRYMFTKHWNINTAISYRRRINDAVDSPIVKDRGSPELWFGGFAIGYTF